MEKKGICHEIVRIEINKNFVETGTVQEDLAQTPAHSDLEAEETEESAGEEAAVALMTATQMTAGTPMAAVQVVGELPARQQTDGEVKRALLK